eukprot:1920195-Prymnesium_polylepis.1
MGCGRVGRGAAGRGEAEGSSKHRVTSGEHMIRRLMRTSHDESAHGGAAADPDARPALSTPQTCDNNTFGEALPCEKRGTSSLVV